MTSLRAVSALAVFSLAVPACIVVQAPPPGTTTAATTAAPAAATPVVQPAYIEVPPPAVTPEDHPEPIAEGHPTALKNGAPEGVWIWHDGNGWHLRTTTAKRRIHFAGRSWAEKGAVGDVHPTRLELNDRFRRTGNYMSFDFVTQSEEDGFDYQTSEANCAHFVINIDGAAHPERIRIGENNVVPRSNVLRLCHK